MQSLLDFDLSYAQPLLGIDEVGLGCIAGPVVAAGVILPEDYVLKRLLLESGVKDSKRLSTSKRQCALEAIMSSGAAVFISSVTASEVDNLGQAVCLDRLYREIISEALKDNRARTILLDGSRSPNIPYVLKTVVKGDNRSLSIAAASIVAKEHRDQIMLNLSRDPELSKYGWDRNNGYPTRDHIEALSKSGPSSRHRMSTKPLAAYRSSKTTPGGSGFLNGDA